MGSTGHLRPKKGAVRGWTLCLTAPFFGPKVSSGPHSKAPAHISIYKVRRSAVRKLIALLSKMLLAWWDIRMKCMHCALSLRGWIGKLNPCTYIDRCCTWCSTTEFQQKIYCSGVSLDWLVTCVTFQPRLCGLWHTFRYAMWQMPEAPPHILGTVHWDLKWGFILRISINAVYMCKWLSHWSLQHFWIIAWYFVNTASLKNLNGILGQWSIVKMVR